jgi:hypothetical protein
MFVRGHFASVWPLGQQSTMQSVQRACPDCIQCVLCHRAPSARLGRGTVPTLRRVSFFLHSHDKERTNARLERARTPHVAVRTPVRHVLDGALAAHVAGVDHRRHLGRARHVVAVVAPPQQLPLARAVDEKVGAGRAHGHPLHGAPGKCTFGLTWAKHGRPPRSTWSGRGSCRCIRNGRAQATSGKESRR